MKSVNCRQTLKTKILKNNVSYRIKQGHHFLDSFALRLLKNKDNIKHEIGGAAWNIYSMPSSSIKIKIPLRFRKKWEVERFFCFLCKWGFPSLWRISICINPIMISILWSIICCIKFIIGLWKDMAAVRGWSWLLFAHLAA